MNQHFQIDSERLGKLCQQWHIKRLMLYGSAARGDFEENSDIDLLAEFDVGHIPGFAFFTIQHKLSELFGRRVDLHTAQSLSKYFREDALSDAQLIYGEAR